MEVVVWDIPNTHISLDDVLVVEAPNYYEKTLRKVLQAFQEKGAHFREKKCIYGAKELTYLKYRIHCNVLHPSKKKLKAIMRATTSYNVQEPVPFLGLITYYKKFFLLQMATLLPP